MGIRCALEFSGKRDVKHCFILEDVLPERQSCSGMCWDQGGSTPGAEVAAGSSEPMVLFAFFCQGLGSVSQNNQLCCPLVCRHRHLVQQRAELPPQHNSVGDLFREKAGPLSWVAECEKAGVFWLHFFLSFPFHLKKPAMPWIPAPASKWMCCVILEYFSTGYFGERKMLFLKNPWTNVYFCSQICSGQNSGTIKYSVLYKILFFKCFVF